MKKLLFPILLLVSIQTSFAANRYWVAGGASNWNNIANWSATSGGASGASVPIATDDVFFNNNGLGNCLVDIAPTINSINLTSAYTGTIDINGNAFNISGNINNDFAGGTINDGLATASLIINSTAQTRFLGTTFGATVNVTSARLYLNGSVFNAATTFTKTGTGNDTGTGGNTFNTTVAINNTSVDYFLLANTNPDIFNGDLTVTNSGTDIIYLAHNSTGNQFNGNIILNATAGTGIRFGNNTGTSTLAATKTITIGGSGFSSGALRIKGFTQTGATSQALTLTGTAQLYLEQNSTWNGNINFVAPRIFSQQNTFNGTASLTKTGASNDYSYGGNIFSLTSTIINNGTGHIYFAQTSGDTFNGDVTLIVGGTGRLYMANTATGNSFNGNIFLNYITNQNIYIGNNSGTSTLANTKTISVIGFGASGTGNLYLEEFTQMGATAQALALNGTGILSIGPNSTFNADIFTTSPGLLVRESTFNGVVSFDKTGASGNTSYGGNTYNGVTAITNSGSNYLRLAGTLGNTYNLATTFSSTGSSRIQPSRVGNSNFNENIFVNSTATSSGIRFGAGGGSATLAATKTINIGGIGFTSGDLEFRNFTQVGNTTQALTCTGTARIYNYDADWGGDVTFIAPRNSTRGTTYNRTAYLEKTGASNDNSAGGNTFNMNVDFVNSGSGYFLLGNGTFDTYNANVTLTNSGTYNMYLAYSGAGHNIAGDLTVTNSGTGGATAGIYIGSTATSALNVTGNVTLTQNGNATSLATYLGDQGDITVNGTVTMSNSGTGTTSDMRIANNTNSSIIIAGATTLTNNNTATTTNRMYIGNSGDVTFNGTLDIINNAGVTNSEIYCNYGATSNNLYNENITVQTTNASSDGIRFGQNGGSSTLAATKTVTIGTGGFSSGDLEFRNFTQVGNTTQALTCTGTARIYNYDADWGGDVTFIAPRNSTRGTLYNRTAYLEKTGATNDQSAGGNTFTMNVDFVNSGSGYFLLGNGTFDTYNANVTLTNSGTYHMYLAYSGAGHNIAGDLTVTNTATGTNNFIYLSNNTGSGLTVNGNTTINNAGTATGNSIYVGYQGDITFNGTVDLNNIGTGTGSEIFCNYGANSNNLYNENITVTSTNGDGIRFGQGGGSSTLAATKTVTIGAGGFSSGDLEFRNFTQVGNTAHALTCTGTARIYNYDADWGGDVTFIAPRNSTRGTLYNRTAYLEKTGATNDNSAGGNTFTMNVDFVNSGSGYFLLGNGTFDTYNANVTLTNSGTDRMYFANNGTGHTIAGDLTVNNNATGTNNYIYLATNTSSDLTVNGNTIINNQGTATNNSIYVGNNGDITFNGTVALNNIGIGPSSEIYCNYNVNSSNIYNENITVSSTNGDGIRFGQNNGTGILAATKTISIGGLGFTSGDLEFRNFTQVGNTAQALTCTGTARIYNYDADWGGDVTFIAPRNITRGTLYNRTAYLEKTGATNDASTGGNIFNGNTTFLNSGTGYFMPAYGTGNDFNANVTYTKASSGLMYPTFNSASTYAGDITVNSATTIRFGAATNGRVIFDGTVAQSINVIGATPPPEMRDVQTINPNNEITLNTPVIVLSELDLQQGNLITTTTNLLYMNDNSTVSSVSDNAFVDGPLEKIGNDAFTFPVGDNSYYRPISMSNPSSGAARFRGEYFKTNPQPFYDRSLKDPTLDHISACEYWLLDRIATTNNVSVTLSWGDTATSCGITNINELTVARWNGSQWKDHGNGGTTGSLLSGTVITSSPVTSFSPFTLASTTRNNPLPIELISFNATLNNNKVDLTWQTASEINNAYFTLEKSKDALNWEVFAEQNGAGNSNSILNYTDVDNNPFKGVSYYRLKQTDFDGKFEYSTIVTVNNLKEGIIAVYPNPVKDILTITNITKQHHVKVYASNGQLIYNGNTTTINTSNWSAGLYQIVITDATGKIIDKLKVVK